MAAARTVYLGGVGSTLTADDVAAIAAGAAVQLDSAALDRLKKESPPPKSFQPLAQPPEPLGVLEHPLSPQHTRATITLKLLELFQGKSKARPALANFLGDLLNTLPALQLPAASDAAALRALSRASMGVGSVDGGTLEAALVAAQQQPPGLSAGEAAAIEAGRAPGGGVACCALVASRTTLAAATAVAALAAEALKADVRICLCCLCLTHTAAAAAAAALLGCVSCCESTHVVGAVLMVNVLCQPLLVNAVTRRSRRGQTLPTST